MIVLDIRHVDESVISGMETDLRHLFFIIRYSDDKTALKNYIYKNKDELADMDEDLYNAISAITDTKELDRLIEANKNMNGGIDMCKALDDIIKDSRAEGLKEGALKKIISQTCRKLCKGKDCTTIASELEEDISLIKNICNIAAGFAPDYDCNNIYNLLKSI